MKKLAILTMAFMLSACVAEKQPQYGNPRVCTTPGTPGGVSGSSYTATPL